MKASDIWLNSISLTRIRFEMQRQASDHPRTLRFLLPRQKTIEISSSCAHATSVCQLCTRECQSKPRDQVQWNNFGRRIEGIAILGTNNKCRKKKNNQLNLTHEYENNTIDKKTLREALWSVGVTEYDAITTKTTRQYSWVKSEVESFHCSVPNCRRTNKTAVGNNWNIALSWERR